MRVLFISHLRSIGYPVVTLGFGFKSYVSYKMRLRKQKEVQKENEFYMQLLQQALPPEQQMLQRQEREAEEGTFQTHTGLLLVASSQCLLRCVSDEFTDWWSVCLSTEMSVLCGTDPRSEMFGFVFCCFSIQA